MKRKNMFAYLPNCSNKNFGRKEAILYLAVLKRKKSMNHIPNNKTNIKKEQEENKFPQRNHLTKTFKNGCKIPKIDSIYFCSAIRLPKLLSIQKKRKKKSKTNFVLYCSAAQILIKLKYMIG